MLQVLGDKKIDYRCSCGSTKIIESTTGIGRSADISFVTFDDHLVMNNPQLDFKNSEIQGYFCKACGTPIRDNDHKRIKTESELVKFLKEL